MASLFVGSLRWVLKPDYITDSHRHGRFLDEQAYEWSFRETSETVAALNPDGTVELGAPMWWRHLAERVRSGGAFCGVRVGVVREAGTAAAVSACCPRSRFSEVVSLPFHSD